MPDAPSEPQGPPGRERSLGRNPDDAPDEPGAEAPPFYEPWLDPTRDFAPGELPTSMTGLAGEVERRVLGTGRFIDRLQSRFTVVAFAYAVFKKYADDEGSRLAALLAYYFFLSIFPLLIGGLAVLNFFLIDQPELVAGVVEDVVPPQYREQVVSAYQALPDSGAAFAVAIIGLIIVGTGGVFSFYAMVNQVFCVPYRFRYGFGPRYIRVLLMVVLLGVGVLLVSIGSAALAHVTTGTVQPLGAFLLLWAVACGLLFIAANVLSRRKLGFREVALGAVLGAFAMTMFITLGSLLVGRFIAQASAVYGAFATVVGFISILFLVSNAVVLSFEISVVRAWRLWPRGVDINLLFPADERAYALLSLMDERMPSQRNGIAFDATGHDDPRRPDPDMLRGRAPGVPVTPYEASDPQEVRESDQVAESEEVRELATPESSSDQGLESDKGPRRDEILEPDRHVRSDQIKAPNHAQGSARTNAPGQSPSSDEAQIPDGPSGTRDDSTPDDSGANRDSGRRSASR